MVGWLDILILAAFIVYAIGSGLNASEEASQSLEEYFLAGRTLKGWQAGLSMAATQFAADTPLLVTGLIATAGIFSLWRIWIYALAFLLVGYVLAGSWRRANVITDAELTELRYGKTSAAVLRGVKAIYFGTIFNCTVLAMVLLAATRIAEPFLRWHLWLPPAVFDPLVSLVRWIDVPLTAMAGNVGDDVLFTVMNLSSAGVPAFPPDLAAADPMVWVLSANNLISIGVIVLVTTFYSTTGGLRSVVRTDVAQFGIAMLATFSYAWVVLDKVGGLGALRDRLHELWGAGGGPAGLSASQILAFTPGEAEGITFAVMAVIAVQWLAQMNSDGTGYLAQRMMACRSEEDARLASVIFTFAQVFLRSLLWLPIGLGLLVLFPPDASLTDVALKAEREATYVRGVAELLPPGILGLALTGMLAALASTVDTHLNWGSSYWTNDIYRRFVCKSWLKIEPSQSSLVWVARCANILILSIGLVIMANLSSIQTAWTGSLLLGAGMGGVLILRWIWWRINATGELAAILASLVLAPVLMLTIPAEHEAWRMLTMAALATVAAIVASLATRPESPELLDSFYKKVRPVGFWGPVATAAGVEPRDDLHRLGIGLRDTVLTALSVFCLLVAVGSWMCGSPAPGWMPWKPAWIACVGLLGLALVPVWMRSLMNPPHPVGTSAPGETARGGDPSP